MSKFYVGQRVRDHILRPEKIGTVEVIYNLGTHRVIVRWDDNTKDSYTIDGRSWAHYAPTLVDADDEWYIVHKPAVRYEKYERILVRGAASDPWIPALFDRYVPDDFWPFKVLDSRINAWRLGRKWDENLVGKVTED